MNTNIKIGEILKAIIYPKRCPMCGEVMDSSKEDTCKECEDKFLLIPNPRCMKCSKPIQNSDLEYCFDCYTKNFHYQSGKAVWIYDKNTKKAMADFKYKGRIEYSSYYVKTLVLHYEQWIKEINPDLIIPVPMHKEKEYERGFNQATLIAKGIGKTFEIKVSTKLLIRHKKTLPQKQLSDRERLRNLESAFSISSKEFKKYENSIHKILIVDDIYTTGSTIEACTKILVQKGITNVYFMSLCIGKGF